MKSGLEGRNNETGRRFPNIHELRLNEVRPRRPEQSRYRDTSAPRSRHVSMKSGLEGRNNSAFNNFYSTVDRWSQ